MFGLEERLSLSADMSRESLMKTIACMLAAFGWSTWFLDCDRVDIRNLTIDADPRFPNGFGIHLGACRDVSVSDCAAHSQDDALVLRAYQEQCRSPRPLECVLVNK